LADFSHFLRSKQYIRSRIEKFAKAIQVEFAKLSVEILIGLLLKGIRSQLEISGQNLPRGKWTFRNFNTLCGEIFDRSENTFNEQAN
jgi:hypothetical protein